MRIEVLPYLYARQYHPYDMSPGELLTLQESHMAPYKANTSSVLLSFSAWHVDKVKYLIQSENCKRPSAVMLLKCAYWASIEDDVLTMALCNPYVIDGV